MLNIYVQANSNKKMNWFCILIQYNQSLWSDLVERIYNSKDDELNPSRSCSWILNLLF